MAVFDVVGAAQRWFDRAMPGGVLDDDKLAAMEALLEAADLALMAGTTTGDIVTGNKNGASFTMRIDATLSQRMQALQLAINGLNNGLRPSRYARAYYPQCP